MGSFIFFLAIVVLIEWCLNTSMENEQSAKLAEMEKKIDAIYVSVEKTRKYFLWTLIITVALFVLPLIGLVFAIPVFISSYTGMTSGMF